MTDERRPPGRLERMAASPWLPLAVASLAIVLTLPALGAGLILDDLYHRSVLLGTTRLGQELGPPSAMFRFFRGDPARMHRFMDLGLLPWWTDPSLKAEFLQALTVPTHRLDYALWPDSLALMHAHNLLWLGAAVAAVAAFYRRMLGPTWLAGVAALLYALDDARGATAGFIANRNVLIAATFGVSALIAHDRWRRGGSRLSAVMAVLLLMAALFSKEEGIGTCAYLAAYGLFADPIGRWRGCLALSPYVVAVVGWRIVRSLWGYGIAHLGHYIDPLDEPGRFLTALPARVPVLLLGQWSPIPAELGVVFRAGLFAPLWWIAVGFLVLLLFAMAPLLRRDHLARFWAAGMLFATVHVAATLPMDRLLTFAGIGAFGLLAQYWAFVFGKGTGAPTIALWRVPARALAWFLIVVHAVFAPLYLPFRARNPLGPHWIEDRLYVRTPLGSDVGDRTLVIVNAPSPGHAGYLIFRQEQSGQPVPRHVRVLAPAIPSVTIRRLDERTLEIRPKGGYLRWALDRVFRTERRAMILGERVELSGMTVTITALTPDGRPDTATFRFDVPLESPSLRWLCFRGEDFVPFTPPAVGEETEIDFDWAAVILPWRSAARASRHRMT